MKARKYLAIKRHLSIDRKRIIAKEIVNNRRVQGSTQKAPQTLSGNYRNNTFQNLESKFQN
jgi:hypothetical protein